MKSILALPFILSPMPSMDLVPFPSYYNPRPKSRGSKIKLKRINKMFNKTRRKRRSQKRK